MDLDVEGGEGLGRSALEARSNALARGLAGRGARIALRFDSRAWADFAVAYLGVLKAHAVAVLLSPGAARPDLVRALSHARAAGLLCPPHLVPPGLSIWTSPPEEVEDGRDTGPLGTAAGGQTLVYPLAPLAPAWSVDPAAPGVLPGGELVHTWAPGSLAGLQALRGLLDDRVTGMATLAAFDPDRLCALVERRRAVSLGLTPALAAALAHSGAPSRHDLSSLRNVVLSGAPPGALGAALPGAEVSVLGAPARPPAGETAPVAVSQEPMLWHEQFSPGSFNLPCLVRRYRGPLDVEALEWALAELARRHQPLRSTFAVVEGEPRQVVGDHAGWRLHVVEMEEDEVAGFLADATGRPFDLVTGPLWDPRLVRLGPDDHLLVVRLHHTVFDDWSVEVFRRELSALYGARVDAAAPPIADPPVTFSDACRRQRARLEGPAGVEERSWWRRELAGAPLGVQLPIGPAASGDGEPVRHDLAPSLAAGVRAVAPGLRATPFMTVLAAFSVLVARVSGQDDLLLATVVAHRNRTDLEALVGCFTKKIPLRLRLGGEPSFAELVARTRASLLGSLSHQDLAFDDAVVAGLGSVAADHGVVPQVAVVFQGETPRQARLVLPGVDAGPYEVPPAARRERHFSAGPDRRLAPAATPGRPPGPAATPGRPPGPAATPGRPPGPAATPGRPPGPAWGDGTYLGTFLVLSLLETTGGMALVARGVFDRPAVGRLLDDFESVLGDLVADPSRTVVHVEPAAGADRLDVRGLRAHRPGLEAALARCPGVADVTLSVQGGCLVADVVPDGGARPSLAALRRALWAERPGAPWPARATVAGDPADVSPDPLAVLLAAMWAEVSGRDVRADSGYWQDFSFLQMLGEAREAGLAITDEHVVRCRTPAMLAAAMGA